MNCSSSITSEQANNIYIRIKLCIKSTYRVFSRLVNNNDIQEYVRFVQAVLSEFDDEPTQDNFDIDINFALDFQALNGKEFNAIPEETDSAVLSFADIKIKVEENEEDPTFKASSDQEGNASSSDPLNNSSDESSDDSDMALAVYTRKKKMTPKCRRKRNGKIKTSDKQKTDNTSGFNEEALQESVNDESLSFQCSFCQKVYKTKLFLRNHINFVHYKVMCAKCDEVCEDSAKYREHRGVCEAWKNRTYNKSLKADRRPSRRRKLKNEAFDAKLERVKCDLCSRQTSKIHFESHKLQHDCLPFCSKCKIALESHEEKKKHADQCDGIALRECALCHAQIKCDRYFLKFSDHHFDRHYLSVHDQASKKLCMTCGRQFSNNHTLDEHMKMHQSENWHVCSICGARFVSKTGMRVHMESHEGRELPCSQCSYVAKALYQLKFHIKHMHETRNAFACETCGRKFSHAKTLKRHMRVHTNEKPYKCDECGQRFNHNVSRKNHMKRMHGIVVK